MTGRKDNNATRYMRYNLLAIIQTVFFVLLGVTTIIVPLYLHGSLTNESIKNNHPDIANAIKRIRRRVENNQKIHSRNVLHSIDDFERYPTLKGTPPLIGSHKGHVNNCDNNVDDLVYWNDPQGIQDRTFKSPFITPSPLPKYVTFEFPVGGWNNVRMALEIIFIFAAATNRTIVLPPKQPIYLLKHNKKNLDFTDFFALDRFNQHNKSANIPNIISAEEFVKRECNSKGRFPLPQDKREVIESVSKVCEHRAKSEIYCGLLHQHVMKHARTPLWKGGSQGDCIVFDEDVYDGRALTPSKEKSAQKFCLKRKIKYYNATYDDTPIIHIHSEDLEYRLLDHFYHFFYFTNSKIHNHYHRFIRDYLRYNDLIYCASGKIIHELQKEGEKLGLINEKSKNNIAKGFYSSLHVRRGDLQFKWVKISAEEWYENTRDVLYPKELLYIATDETNRSFFDPLISHNYTLRMLNDYKSIIDSIEPAYYGMIDTIVASYGRQFIGTGLSTFTNYINRVRGYRGFSMNSSWYGTINEKSQMHVWDDETIKNTAPFVREFPDAWIGIDGDQYASRNKF